MLEDLLVLQIIFNIGNILYLFNFDFEFNIFFKVNFNYFDIYKFYSLFEISSCLNKVYLFFNCNIRSI